MEQLSFQLAKGLREKSLSDGGFIESHGSGFRPDSTAWATLALNRGKIEGFSADPARKRLQEAQLKDGRVPVSASSHQAYWPTSICILAWEGAPAFAEPMGRAVGFLMENTGNHWPKEPGSPLAHDTGLVGWPWIENTHSWVEPTAMAVIALRVAGYGGHPRVHSAVEMLLNRQLAQGGWNYGNTVVYGKELQAMPDATGLALQALAGLVPREKLVNSLEILKAGVGRLRTPFSLSWALLGLSAWGERPENAQILLSDCLERQAVYGEYTTTQLSLLSLALQAQTGFSEIFEKMKVPP